MRLTFLVLATLIVGGLGACSSTDGPDGRSGLAQSFSLDNYRRSNDTNGLQTRPDVNRAYTQPSLPTIGNRGM